MHFRPLHDRVLGSGLLYLRLDLAALDVKPGDRFCSANGPAPK